MRQVSADEADEAFAQTSSLLVCDRCEKVRSVKGAVPDGRWTCCHQAGAAAVAPGAAAGERWREGGARWVLLFFCVGCLVLNAKK